MKTYKLKDIISQGTKDLFYIWWQELKAVVFTTDYYSIFYR